MYHSRVHHHDENERQQLLTKLNDGSLLGKIELRLNSSNSALSSKVLLTGGNMKRIAEYFNVHGCT